MAAHRGRCRQRVSVLFSKTYCFASQNLLFQVAKPIVLDGKTYCFGTPWQPARYASLKDPWYQSVLYGA